MIKRRYFFLAVIFFLSSFQSYDYTKNISLVKLEQSKGSADSDSLFKLVKEKGWNLNLLTAYHHALHNMPSINCSLANENLNMLHGTYEKIFLHSILLKKKGDFKAMFDSLLTGLKFQPAYYPYYDELVFSANASGQIKKLIDILTQSNQTADPIIYYTEGLISSHQGKQKEALIFFLKADSLTPNNKNVLFNLAHTYKSLGDYKNSLSIIKKMKKEFSDDAIILPKLLIAEGTLAYLSNNYKSAENLFNDAFEHAIKIDDKISQSKALIDLGIIRDVNEDIAQARKYFNKGIQLAAEVGDLESIAFGNSELGVSYTLTNELVDSKKHYLASYDLYKRLGSSVRLSLLSNNIGRLYMNFSDYKSALNYFEEGIKLAGDDKRAMALNTLSLADVYSNLSNYSKALKYYREAQKLSSEIKELSVQTDITTGLGTLNFNLNRFNNAVNYYKLALENNPNSYLAAEVHHKLGLTYLRMDSLNSAELHFKKALELAATSKNEYAAAITYVDLADFYFKQNNYTAANACLKKGKAIAEKNNWKQLKAESEILEGDINAKQKLFLSAKQHYQNALKIAEDINILNLQVLCNYSLAKLFHSHGFIEAAESHYQSGIALIENISRPLFEDSEVQMEYFNTTRDLYDSYAHLLLERKNYKEAFIVIEKSRSRNTMQNLLNLKLASIIDSDSLIEKLYELGWMINSGIYNQYEVDSLKYVLSNIKVNLMNSHPQLKSFFEEDTRNLVDELQQILSENQNFISIYLTENNSYLFLITKQNFEAIELKADKNKILDLTSKVSPYFDPETRSNYFFNKDLFAFNSKYAHELYRILMKPATDRIPKQEKIIISLPGELLTFPLEFLITDLKPDESIYNYSDKKYLIHDYTISYIPSAKLYLEEVENKLINMNKVLIVGNPLINEKSDLFADRRGLLEESVSRPRNITLLPLRYSLEEVNMIGNLIRADRLFTAKDATETNFKQHAELSKIIHLSTHSVLFEKQPVIFFSNVNDIENDGLLEASEIIQLKLNSDLVVLSSCNSGLGRVDESEGIIGMTKAFFDAGSKSVVVSLWEVNDMYTSKLMTNFYQKLSEGYDKSEALRLAKIEFIEQYSPNPYFWAAFILWGNTSEIQLETASVFPSLIIFILAGFLFIGIIYLASIRKRFPANTRE